MRHSGAEGFRFALAALAVGISTSPAHAYLDPGTGSMLLQVLLGGLAGLLVVIKLYWHKLLALIGMGGSLQRERRVEADERGRR